MAEHAARFDGLAEAYALHRPGYPPEAFAALLAGTATPARIAVDVGAGPGNSTAALRATLPDDWLVMAIEPGEDMRRVLTRTFREDARVQVGCGAAEALPLPDGCAGMVTACTSFHWFDSAAFYAEATRVLAPGGVLALLRNRRRPAPLIEAFDAYVARQRDALADHPVLGRAKEPTVRALGALPGFGTARSATIGWQQETDCRGLIDLYLTRSVVWALVRRFGLGTVMADLGDICAAQSCADGPLTLAWETTVKWVQKR